MIKNFIGKGLLLFVFIFSFSEIGAYLVGKYLISKSIFYETPDINRQDYERYLKLRDPALGWPPKKESVETPSPPTPRPVPQKFSGQPCFSVYGNSFTYGSEVQDQDAWPFLVSKSLSCSVANYGVGGYGTDMAYLRFLTQKKTAEVAVLGFMPENIMRNVTQYMSFLYAGPLYGFKPRFILNQKGDLERVPLPKLNYHEFTDVFKNPSTYLKHEYFLPFEDHGRLPLGFPYSLSILRALNHFRIHAAITKTPVYAEFYHQKHAAKGLQITVKIMEAFIQKAHERSQEAFILILPTGRDLLYFKREKKWVFQPLLDALKKQNIPYYNPGPHLLHQLGTEEIETLFVDISSHYNAKGNRFLANAFLDQFQTVPASHQ